MLSAYRNICKVMCNKMNLRFVSCIGNSDVFGNNIRTYHSNAQEAFLFHDHKKSTILNRNILSSVEIKRRYSKKKGSKRVVEVEEESDSEEEEEYQENVDDIGDNVITRTVPSLRLDSILKAGLGITKKKIEQDFYGFKLRINGNKVLKKATNVHVGDEVDRIRGFSPDTLKFIIVDRVIIKGVGSITGSGMYPVKMEVLKELTIENYEEPWDPSSLGELEK